MQVILTTRKDYLLNPNLSVSYSIEDLYKQINNKSEDDGILHIFIDNMFVSTTNLKQIEMYSTLVDNFKIIVNKDLSYLLNLNKALDLRFYYQTTVTKTAANLFWNASELELGYDLNDLKSEFERITSNEQILKNMMDYDIVNLKTLFNSIGIIVKELEKSQFEMSENLDEFVRENKLLKENLILAKERNEEIESNRLELLESNLKLKYNGYIDETERRTSETSTPILYIKAPLTKSEQELTNFTTVLREHIQNKYNRNVCLIIIEDSNSLRIKKLYPDFNYVNSVGEYNIGLGNKIATTPQYLISLMDNFEQFSGIKDLFIFLDLSITPYVYVIGEGNLVFIKNDRLSESILESLDDSIIVVEESEVADMNRGEDSFNMKLNITKSDIFKKIEEISINISL